jgi:hypothetical protein
MGATLIAARVSFVQMAARLAAEGIVGLPLMVVTFAKVTMNHLGLRRMAVTLVEAVA